MMNPPDTSFTFGNTHPVIRVEAWSAETRTIADPPIRLAIHDHAAGLQTVLTPSAARRIAAALTCAAAMAEGETP